MRKPGAPSFEDALALVPKALWCLILSGPPRAWVPMSAWERPPSWGQHCMCGSVRALGRECVGRSCFRQPPSIRLGFAPPRKLGLHWQRPPLACVCAWTPSCATSVLAHACHKHRGGRRRNLIDRLARRCRLRVALGLRPSGANRMGGGWLNWADLGRHLQRF